MENAVNNLMNKITTLRFIIKENFPEKYKELLVSEEVWGNIDLSIVEYQRWVDKNIPLDKNNTASIVVYSIVYSRSIEQVEEFSNSKQI